MDSANELFFTALGCVSTLVMAFVAVCASVAAARARGTKGLVVLALGAWLTAGVGALDSLVELSRMEYDAATIAYVLIGGLALAAKLGMLVGMGLTTPAPKEGAA